MKTSVILARPQGSNIETLRLIAVFALVSFHAIGASPENGLGVDYPHPLRYLADGLIDLRMPLFALISGWVYAQRPVVPKGFGAFLWAKLRRLYVPGVAAAFLLWAFKTFFLPDAIAQAASIWEVFTLSYAHFWFLHALLLILSGIAITESLLPAPLQAPPLIGAVLVFLMLPTVYVPGLQLEGAQYLAPFFIIGIQFVRCAEWVNRHRIPIAVLALVAAAWGLALNIEILRLTGEMSLDRHDLQSALLSTGLITLLLLFLPRIGALTGFGSLAFTVYLYHVFGTSGMRHATEAIGIEQTWLVFILCVASGFVIPTIIHLLCSRTAATRKVFLGLRPVRSV